MIGRNRDDKTTKRTPSISSDPIASARNCTRSVVTPTRRCRSAADARLRDERSRPTPSSSTIAAITTAMRRRAFRRSSSPRRSIPTTTPTPTRCRRSSFGSWRASTELVYETAVRARQPRSARRRATTGAASREGHHVSDASAADHLPHDLRQPGRLRHHHPAAAVLRGDVRRIAARPSACCSRSSRCAS